MCLRVNFHFLEVNKYISAPYGQKSPNSNTLRAGLGSDLSGHTYLTCLLASMVQTEAWWAQEGVGSNP